MSTVASNLPDGGSPERGGLEVVRDPSVITAIRDVNQSAVADFLYARGVEILGMKDDGSVLAPTPFEVIDNTEVPVRERHVRHLMKLLDRRAAKFGGEGQEQPVQLALIPGVDKLKISDGFHRSKAQQRRGEAGVFAGTLLSDWDELYDSRILNTDAEQHQHIRFARVLIWMNEIWELTGYPEHMSLEQATLLVGLEGKGNRVSSDPEVVEAAKGWVTNKSEIWNLSPMTIHGYLRVRGAVDPELLEITRTKEDGELEGPTQDIVKVLAEKIPNNYELQQMVVDAAIDHNLGTAYVRTVCEQVQYCANNGEAGEVIAGIDWDTLSPTNKTRGTARISRYTDPRTSGEKVLDSSLEEIERAIERAKAIAESGEPLTPQQRQNVEKLDKRIRAIQGAALKYTLVIDEILDLPDAPEPTKAEPAKQAAGRRRGRVTAADKYAKAKAAREKEDGVHLAQPKTRDAHETFVSRSVFESELLAYLNGTAEDCPFIDTRQTVRSAERLISAHQNGFPMADRVEEVREAIADHKKISGR